MAKIRLDDVIFDAGTQIRASIDQAVVSDYAEAMTNGATFPPIVLFHDGNRHYLADGFHRYMAAQRNQWREIDADVRAGTKDDALWFALGANRLNGHRLTLEDKRHALTLARQHWPDRSARQIAEHVGCSSTYASRIFESLGPGLQPVDRVVGADGVTYPASREARDRTRARAIELLEQGKSVDAVRAETGIGRDTARQLKQEVIGLDRTKAGIQKRVDTMRRMAEEGHTSRQIAAAVGLSDEGCRNTLKREAIDVPADKVVRNTHRHDANRILERIVMDAENLTVGHELIDFEDVDPERLGDWIDSLNTSKKALEQFIRRLVKERAKHGEAA